MHALIVHWPLAFLSTAYAINAFQPLLPYLHGVFQRRLPSNAELESISYYALSAGLLTGIPALVAGVLQAGEVMNKQGSIYEADGKTLKPKVKTLWTHAGLNDVVLLGSVAYWWMRPQSEEWKVGLSILLGGMLLYTANLGAKLVFNFGTGMQVGKASEKTK